MNIATNLRRPMDERDLTPARLSERSGVRMLAREGEVSL